MNSLSTESPGPEVRTVATGLEFPEGPIALDDGSLLVTEIAAGTLARVRADGTVDRVAELGGGPNGAAIGPDGAVYVCNNGGSFSFHRHGDLLVFGLVAPSGTGRVVAIPWPRPGRQLAFTTDGGPG